MVPRSLVYLISLLHELPISSTSDLSRLLLFIGFPSESDNRLIAPVASSAKDPVDDVSVASSLRRCDDTLFFLFERCCFRMSQSSLAWMESSMSLLSDANSRSKYSRKTRSTSPNGIRAVGGGYGSLYTSRHINSPIRTPGSSIIPPWGGCKIKSKHSKSSIDNRIDSPTFPCSSSCNRRISSASYCL